MTVYRVQNAEGKGPYANMDMGTVGARPSDRRPDPRKDFSDDYGASKVLEANRRGNGVGSEHLFGFERPEHAHEWFGREKMRKLRMMGYDVVPVQAKKVHRAMSGKQVLYEPFGKAELPMPNPGPQHHDLNLPVGATRDGRIKVRHADGTASWVEVRAGIVMSQDGHAISALRPGGR